MSDFEEVVESNQQQAVAAWIDHLNQVRLDRLFAALAQQETSLSKALSSVDEALVRISQDVVSTNRGGQKGMHGFIAEVAEEGIGNARAHILGQAPPYQWVNDNGPVDLFRNSVPIQQKFVAAGGRFGLGAISEHLQKYPGYIRAGGRYQIPSDHFEAVKRLRDMSAEDAGKLLGKSEDGFSHRDWQRVQRFFEDISVPFESLEPSTLEYSQVQRGTYEATLDSEMDALRGTNQDRRVEAHRLNRPSMAQGVQAAAGAAAFEGGTAFVLALIAKRREGRKLKDFTDDDWKQIVGETGFGAIKGGIRGLSIYGLTNFTATSAAVASSIVTAVFGIAEQANRLRRGEIGEQEFLENAELVSLEAAISALSSCAGQALIPIPVLGAVIGNTVGTIMYRSASSALSNRESALIARYFEEQQRLDEELAQQYRGLIDELVVEMAAYVDLLDRAFSPDLETALDGSIELALSLDVPADEVLDSSDKARAYFMD